MMNDEQKKEPLVVHHSSFIIHRFFRALLPVQRVVRGLGAPGRVERTTESPRAAGPARTGTRRTVPRRRSRPAPAPEGFAREPQAASARRSSEPAAAVPPGGDGHRSGGLLPGI